MIRLLCLLLFSYLPVYFPASSLDWITQPSKSSRFVDQRLRMIRLGIRVLNLGMTRVYIYIVSQKTETTL